MRARREIDERRTGRRTARLGRAGAALLLSALLAVPLAIAGGGATPAQAADGRGTGKGLLIGVAADEFATKGTDKIDIEAGANPKYPGTVRFTKKQGNSQYVYCLSTDTRNFLQWTGCNSDASKQWVIEPLAATDVGAKAADPTRIDYTEAAANKPSGTTLPRFVIRNYKYPDLCIASKTSGFTMLRSIPETRGERKFLTSKCSASDTAANLRTQFAITNDSDGLEWEFLRQQMTAGAQALAMRKADKWFSGDNLSVKPLDAQGNPIAASSGASTGGYFLPSAIGVDPRFRSAIVSTQSVARDCAAGGLWWSVYNGTANPLTRDISTERQHTDSTEYGISVTASGSWESPSNPLTPTGQWTFGLEIGGSVNWAKSDSVTKSDSITYTIPARRYGLAVVSTETTTVRGLWKSGTALNREWTVPGILSVATKSKDGVPQSELAAYEANEQKSCLAAASTTVVDGEPFEVGLPDSRVAPVVGDTVTAEAAFVQPGTPGAPPIDVRYQWYADKEPIVGQTSREFVVRAGHLGKQLSFSAFENGGSMRFESETYYSLQTAPVLAQAGDAIQGELQSAPVTVDLPDGIVDMPYEVSLGDVHGIADTVTLDPAQLPLGLSFDAATETISGTPTRVGSFNIDLETAEGDALTATLAIDAAPTVWPTVRGKSVRVGAPFTMTVVSEPGTNAGYQIDFLTSAGDLTPRPAGVRLSRAADGSLVLEGAITSGGEWLVRTTEISPYPDAGDGRQLFDTLRLSVDADAALLVADDAQIELPLGAAASVQLAEIPSGADALPLTGDLPAGVTFDASTGVLSGTPSAAGTYPLQLGPTADGDSASIELVVFDKPEIEIVRHPAQSAAGDPERRSDGATAKAAAKAAADLAVGEHGAWRVTASHADDLTATVREHGGTAKVDWAVFAAPAGEEAWLEAEPTEPGRYTIEVTASNEAGTSTRTLDFEVAREATGGSDGGGSGSGGASGGAQGGADGGAGGASGASDAGGSGSAARTDGAADAADGAAGNAVDARGQLPTTGAGLSGAVAAALLATALAAAAVGAMLLRRAARGRGAP